MKKIVLFGQIVIICLGIFCGCQKKEEINFEIGIIHGRNFDKTVKVIIISLEQWEKSDFSKMFSMDEKYDDDFFGENNLILVAFKTSSGFEIKDIKIFKNARHLIVEVNGNNFTTSVIGEVILALEVKKEGIAVIKKVNIETNLYKI